MIRVRTRTFCKVPATVDGDWQQKGRRECAIRRYSVHCIISRTNKDAPKEVKEIDDEAAHTVRTTMISLSLPVLLYTILDLFILYSRFHSSISFLSSPSLIPNSQLYFAEIRTRTMTMMMMCHWILTLQLLLACFLCSVQASNSIHHRRGMVGAYFPAKVNDPFVQTVTDFAMKELRSSQYEFVTVPVHTLHSTVVQAQQQVRTMLTLETTLWVEFFFVGMVSFYQTRQCVCGVSHGFCGTDTHMFPFLYFRHLVCFRLWQDVTTSSLSHFRMKKPVWVPLRLLFTIILETCLLHIGGLE